MNQLQLAGLVLGFLFIGILAQPKIEHMLNEKKLTRIFTGVNPVEFYGPNEVLMALQEFQDRAKEIWNKQNPKQKNLNDIALEIYSEDQRGDLSVKLHHVIQDAKTDDPDFLQKQVNVSLQREINRYVANELSIRKSIYKVAEGLEVTKQDVCNWVMKYHLDKPVFLKDPRYFYYDEDVLPDKGFAISRSKGRSDYWETPKFSRKTEYTDQVKQINTSVNKFQNSPIKKEGVLDNHSSSNQLYKRNQDFQIKNKTVNKNEESIKPKKSYRFEFHNSQKSKQKSISPQPDRKSDLGSNSFAPANSPHQFNGGGDSGRSITINRSKVLRSKKKYRTGSNPILQLLSLFRQKVQILFRKNRKKEIFTSNHEFVELDELGINLPLTNPNRSVDSTVEQSNHLLDTIPLKRNLEEKSIENIDVTEQPPIDGLPYVDTIEEIWDYVLMGYTYDYIHALTGIDRSFIFHLMINMMYLNILINSLDERKKENQKLEKLNHLKGEHLKEILMSILDSMIEMEGEFTTEEIERVVHILNVAEGDDYDLFPDGSVNNAMKDLIVKTHGKYNLFEFQALILSKLAFYANFNEFGTDIWERGVVISGRTSSGSFKFTVKDILGNLVKNTNVHRFLGSISTSTRIINANKIRTEVKGKQIEEIDPIIRYELESNSLEQIGYLRLDSRDVSFQISTFESIWNKITTKSQNLANKTGLSYFKDKFIELTSSVSSKNRKLRFEENPLIPKILVSQLKYTPSNFPVEKIIKLDHQSNNSGGRFGKPFHLFDGTVSEEFEIKYKAWNVLDIHSQILAKLCFYAYFNDINSWGDKGVFQTKIDGKGKLLAVKDVLGKNQNNPQVYNLLKEWFNPNFIDKKFQQDLPGKNIFSVDPSIRYSLENKPREFFKNMRVSSDDYELSQIILTETGLAALLTTDNISNGIIINRMSILHSNQRFTPTSPMLSRVTTDKKGERYGAVTVPTQTRKGSDKLFLYKQHLDFEYIINVNGRISMKHVGVELNEFAYRSLRLAKINSTKDVKSINDKFLMGVVDESRTGDHLKTDGSRFLFPYRYHSLDGFGASSIDRIGRDLKLHFGITTGSYFQMRLGINEPLWNNITDRPSKMLFIAGYNNIVTHEAFKVGLDSKNDYLITTDFELQNEAIRRIKQNLFGPGEFDCKIDELLLTTEAFHATRRIYDGFQARFEEALLFELMYSKRTFGSHKMERSLSWEEIPQGNVALKKWNEKLKEEWVQNNPLSNNKTPEIILYDSSIDRPPIRSIEDLHTTIDYPLKLRVYTGSRLQLLHQINLLNNPIVEVEIRPSNFWIADEDGRLGLRSNSDVDLSYYSVEPEYFRDWLTAEPSDIYGRSGDKSTIRRRNWYKKKIEELTTPDGEWTVLHNARRRFDDTESITDFRTLVNARIEFIDAAPTEGPIREMQREVFRRLVRNPKGGLASHFSDAFSQNGDEVVFAPYTHVLEIMGYSGVQALNDLEKALSTSDLLQTFDQILFSPLSSEYNRNKNNDKKSEEKFKIDVTGKVLRTVKSRKRATAKLEVLLRLIELKTGGALRALLDPSFVVDRSEQLAAGKYNIKVMDSPDKYSRYTRDFSDKDLAKVTSNKPQKDGKIYDARWLGTFIVDEVNRDRIFYGIDNLLKNISDPNKAININFSPRMYDHLRKYVMVKMNKQVKIPATDSSLDRVWTIVIKKNSKVKDSYIDEDGTTYKFEWKVEKGKQNGEKYITSLNVLSRYFFISESKKIDFSNLRRTKEKGSVYVRTNLVGIATFLIIDATLDIYEKALKASESTIYDLEKANWLTRNSKTGNLEVGRKFKELLVDTDPANSIPKIRLAIAKAILEISNLDSTGWLTKIYRFMASNSHKQPVPWVQYIFAGIPSEYRARNKTIPKSEFYNLRSQKQLNSVKNGLLYGFDTIKKYVGPNIIEPSWKWRQAPNLKSMPNLDRAFSKGASWFNILTFQEIEFLKTIRNSILTNNFNLIPEEYYRLLAELQIILRDSKNQKDNFQ
ncbi:MAG: hypothetical protein HeimC2_39700 [Candidatus Heimdallarchaeota archaeon LC_2]|nr:MAG: hypothetical protein HeimC2_39700 [Candidatus Heimdallarchaeota archaeon LC_2]